MARGRKDYTDEGLALLIGLVKIHASLEEISEKVGRPVYGVMQKMRKISKDNPELLDPKTLKMYGRQFYEIEGRDRKIAYRLKKRATGV